jgi:predicted DCC family thiol-disulfide oxidoreductase YuxK
MAGAIAAAETGPTTAGSARDLVFFDGDCGFCHRTVVHLVEADPEGALFAFAPIGGETFRALVPADVRGTLPDSIIVRTTDGRILLQSAGVLHIAHRLGGRRAGFARVLGFLPGPLRDAAYGAFARIRHHLLARPVDACPLVPPEQRERFLA